MDILVYWYSLYKLYNRFSRTLKKNTHPGKKTPQTHGKHRMLCPSYTFKLLTFKVLKNPTKRKPVRMFS